MTFTWEKFRTDRIAVWCRSEEQAIMFLSACRRKGFCFKSGAELGIVTHWRENREYTVYTLRLDRPEIEYHGVNWVRRHGYEVILAEKVMDDLETPEVRYAKSRLEELMKKPVVNIGTAEWSKGEKNSHAHWRDAEADKPQKDGEYIVCAVGVMDCEFQKRVYLTEFKTASGWEYVEGEVITHWLDNAPSLPEVVVR